MKMRQIIVAEYEATDDPASRERFYGTTDPHEMAKVDQETPAEELLATADRIVSHTVIPNGEDTPLEAFARWVVALDDPDPDSQGFQDRKAVTLGRIIDRAREALGITEED